MKSRPIYLGLFCAVLSLSACGGGGTTLPPSPNSTPTPLAAPSVSSPAPYTAAQTLAVPASGPNGRVPLALPSSSSGVSGTITLASGSSAIPANTTVDESSSSIAPSGLPALSRGRVAESRSALADGQKVGLAYTQLTFSQTISLPSTPSFSFTLPTSYPMTNVSYYLALYDPLRPTLGFQYDFEGPATLIAAGSGTTFAFAANPNAFTFNAGVTYTFVLFAISSAATAPTPAPSTAPIAPPATPAPVIASPSSLTFTSAGTAAAQSFTVSQSGGSGSFKENDTCANVATIALSGAKFTVTPVAGGSCTIFAVGDGHANTPVNVTVAISNVGITIGVPTATPSAAPTSTPKTSVVITIAPNPILVTGFGSLSGVTVTAAESGYTGAFVASILDPSIAGIVPVPGGFKVTGNKAGSTSAIFVDGSGASTNATVTVTAPSPSPTPSPVPVP